MARLNQCNFIGNLGQDVEIRYTPDGKAVSTISLAVDDSYKDQQGNKVDQTQWVRVVAFGRLAEIMAEYLHKGSSVFISGKWSHRKWQDKDGNDRYTTEIIANEMQMLGSRGGAADSVAGSDSRQGTDGGQPSPQSAADFDDDIPF